MRERFRPGVPTRWSGRPATGPGLLFGATGDAVEHRGFGRSRCNSCFMLIGVRSTLLERRHRIPVGDAALGSKGWKVQRIKPSLALPLRAVEAELIAAAAPAVAQGPLVERRRSIAVLQPSAPIANGRQGPLDEAARLPRPMRNPAPTAVRGLRVDCSHISAPNAIEPASSYAGDVQCNLMLQTRVSHRRLRDFHAVNAARIRSRRQAHELQQGHRKRADLRRPHSNVHHQAKARLINCYATWAELSASLDEGIVRLTLSRSIKPEAGCAIMLARLHSAIR